MGETALALAFVVLSAGAAGAVVTGVRIWRPADARTWYLMAAAMTSTFLASVVSGVLPLLFGRTDLFEHLADIPFAISYFFGIAFFIRAARARANDRDPTNLIDAAIVVGAVAALSWLWVIVPNITDSQLPVLERATNAGFALLWLTLATTVARLAIGPGARTQTYYRIIVAAICVIATDFLRLVEPSALVDILFVTGMLGVVVGVATAALHPSMPALIGPSDEPIGRMSAMRMVSLVVAALIAPTTVVAKWQGSFIELGGIVFCWVLLSLLILARLAGLIRSRERAAAIDLILKESSADLAGCTTNREMGDVAFRAMYSVSEAVHPIDAFVVRFGSDDEFFAGDRSGETSRIVSADDLDDDVVIRRSNGAYLTAARLVWRGETRGYLAVVSTERPGSQLCEAFGTIARTVSLAWESASSIEEAQRQRVERRFRSLIEQSNDIVVVLRTLRDVVFVSPAVERLLGVATRDFDLLGHVHTDDRTIMETIVSSATSAAIPSSPQLVRMPHANGYLRWFEVVATNCADDPDIGGIVITAREVTDRKRAEDWVIASEARFRALVQNSSDLVILLDDTTIRYVSPSVEPLLGYELGTINDSPLDDLVHPEDLPAFMQALGSIARRSIKNMELRLQTRDAEWRVFEITLTDLRHHAAVQGIILNGHDVTTRKVLEGDLRHRALHDELTGLGNRFVLKEKLEAAIARRRETNHVHALLFVDLDDFKTVNDSLGHAAGDLLLQIAAQRISTAIGENDTAARLGGDEFAVLLEDIDAAGAENVASRVLETMLQPIKVEGIEITSTASIGIAFVNGSDRTAEIMLRDADAAMYYAKGRGKGRYEVFDQAMHAHAVERLQLKGNLKGVCDRDELRAFYQPIVDMQSGRILGFESLMRWQHPDRGLVPPIAFIPLAEETGDIVAMGHWLMEESIRQLAEWQRQFPHLVPLGMSLNLSGRQLEDDEFPRALAVAISANGLNPADITIELTESRPITSPEAIARLERIVGLGVHLAADDFGSGEASYAALQSHPYTVVKVDRSLVQGLGTPAHERAVAQLRSISDLAKSLGYRTVVEGVEDASQLQILASLGFDRAQGFYFGRPTAADTAASLMATVCDLPLSA